jgi:hypothetical protein
VEKKYQEYGNKTRKPAVAGIFYPANPKELKDMIEKFTQTTKTKPNEKLKAIISPHAGYIYSGIVAGKAYSLIKKLEQKKQWKTIIIGPSHFIPFNGAANSGAQYWETPLGKVKTSEKGFMQYPHSHSKEHSIETQIPFLQCSLKKFTINPIVYGKINPEKLAEQIKELIDEDTIIIASSDLSHYYTYDEAIAIDSIANKAIPSLDIETTTQIEACGLTGIIALMHIAKKLNWKGKLLDYKNSGDTAGNKNSVVGYGAYAFFE